MTNEGEILSEDQSEIIFDSINDEYIDKEIIEALLDINVIVNTSDPDDIPNYILNLSNIDDNEQIDSEFFAIQTEFEGEDVPTIIYKILEDNSIIKMILVDEDNSLYNEDESEGPWDNIDEFLESKVITNEDIIEINFNMDEGDDNAYDSGIEALDALLED